MQSIQAAAALGRSVWSAATGRGQLEQLLQRVRRDADYASRLNARCAELGVPTSDPLAGAINHAASAMAALEQELNRCLSIAPEAPEPQSKREMKVIKRQSQS